MAAQDVSVRGMGAAAAELEHLALDPAVAATAGSLERGERSQPVFLRAPARRLPWSTRVDSPFAADEFTMPAQERLGPRLQRRPGLTHQHSADRRQDQAVGWLPAWWAEMMLQHSELLARSDRPGGLIHEYEQNRCVTNPVLLIHKWTSQSPWLSQYSSTVSARGMARGIGAGLEIGRGLWVSGRSL